MEFLRVCSLIFALSIVSSAVAMKSSAVDHHPMREPVIYTQTQREGLKDAGALYRLARAACSYIEDGNMLDKIQIEDLLNEGVSPLADLLASDWNRIKPGFNFQGSVVKFVYLMLDSEETVRRMRVGELLTMLNAAWAADRQPGAAPQARTALVSTYDAKNDLIIGCVFIALISGLIALWSDIL